MNPRELLRREILASYGANAAQQTELLAYNRNCFDLLHAASSSYPLDDEHSVCFWSKYAEECDRAQSITPLRHYLVQLNFPVSTGISMSPKYRAAISRGMFPGQSEGLEFEAPERCRVSVYLTPAGRIPVIFAERRCDFVNLVRALSKKNEPVRIPESMGACMISGYLNWHRANRICGSFEDALASENGVSGWLAKFEKIRSSRNLYQDRFVLLSDGPYSGISADRMGLSVENWRAVSLEIRREHECAHYFTRRAFGSMKNNLLDELIADYMGIVCACGYFRSDWFLRFMGLEDGPEFGMEGRFANYLSDPPVSQSAAHPLARLLIDAARNVERFFQPLTADLDCPAGKASMLIRLAAFTLEELAFYDRRALPGILPNTKQLTPLEV